MKTPPDSSKPVIVLIGNYPLDRQESMLRFRNLVQTQLEATGHEVVSIFPEGRFGLLLKKGSLAKWLGYVDKYILFPAGLHFYLGGLKKKYAGRKIVVHICDHSNSVYSRVSRKFFPVLVTCHDLLAVRGAMGEDTDCPASGFGKILQARILQGLREATAVACVSKATQGDLVRLGGEELAARSEVVPLALNYAYKALTREEATGVLTAAGIELPYRGYVFHVGSNLRRKNRAALIFSVAKIKDKWTGPIVFAGEKLTLEEWAEARAQGIASRVREISRPSNEVLSALYSAAHAFIFMSRFEGFGWPILEAQMAECPVICSNRTSVPEVAGAGAFVHEPDDYAAIAQDILHLQDSDVRDNVVALGVKNALGYSIERMMGSYEEIYRRL